MCMWVVPVEQRRILSWIVVPIMIHKRCVLRKSTKHSVRAKNVHLTKFVIVPFFYRSGTFHEEGSNRARN